MEPIQGYTYEEEGRCLDKEGLSPSPRLPECMSPWCQVVTWYCAERSSCFVFDPQNLTNTAEIGDCDRQRHCAICTVPCILWSRLFCYLVLCDAEPVWDHSASQTTDRYFLYSCAANGRRKRIRAVAKQPIMTNKAHLLRPQRRLLWSLLYLQTVIFPFISFIVDQIQAIYCCD